MLVLTTACKCHPKFTPRGAESAEGAEGQSKMAGGTDNRDASDPTYMEVGEEGENAMELNRNKAYGINTCS